MATDPGTNVTAKLVIAVRSGKLGELEVDPYSLNITEAGEKIFFGEFRRNCSVAT